MFESPLWWQLPVALAAAVWLPTGLAGLVTWRRLRLLADDDSPAPEPWPSLSMVVPARNEVTTLGAAADTWRDLHLPELEVVVVDDRSDDGTGPLADQLAERDPRLSVIHVDALPPGWLGKNHALSVGAARARGDWLLFTDADVHMQPELLRRALAYATSRELDHLAVLPDVPGGKSFLLDCAVAQFGRNFPVMQRVWAVDDPDSSAFVGVGAFNLVRREALERTAGLEWLRMDVVDDLALGKLMKTSGARCGVAVGARLLSVDWYTSLRDMVVGLEKNVWTVMGCSVAKAWSVALLGLVIDLSPLVALAAGLSGGPWWLTVLGVHGAAVAVSMGVGMAVWSRRPWLPGVLWPVGSLLMAFTVARAAFLGWRRGGIRWRDTFYPNAELRAGSRVTL